LPAPERVVPPRPDQTTTRTWHSSSKIKARIIVRRQDDSNQGDDRSDEADRALPPQPPPAQSFLGGLFGGDRNDSWQPDDRDRGLRERTVTAVISRHPVSTRRSDRN